MKRQNLILYSKGNNLFRTVIKTKHGRLIYLELTKSGTKFTVMECYYIDRVKSVKYYAVPSKQQTKCCHVDKLLEVVSSELDRQYYGFEFTDELVDLSTESFIQNRLLSFKCGYKFLIFIGEGAVANGMPDKLKTRLANRIHRKIYLEIDRYDEHRGVVTKCCYYDRQYKSRNSVTPQMLTSVFVNYDRKSITDMVNREMNCDFTDLIIIEDTIGFDNSNYDLCGNIYR